MLIEKSESQRPLQARSPNHERIGDSHVLLLSLVESSDTLDSHVVRFSSSRSENDIFRVCSDEIRNVLSAREDGA